MSLDEQLKKWKKEWDRGEYVYNSTEEELMKLKDGEKIEHTLNNCTICPIHDATCNDCFTIIANGFHPEKGIKEFKIIICPLGVQNIDHCLLSKPIFI